jgi:hypothetical protein
MEALNAEALAKTEAMRAIGFRGLPVVTAVMEY